MAASESFSFLACNFIKKRGSGKDVFSVDFAKCLRTSFLLTEQLRITASCVYLRILRSFSEHFFYRTPPGNCYFHVPVVEFQPPDTVKNYFTGAF